MSAPPVPEESMLRRRAIGVVVVRLNSPSGGKLEHERTFRADLAGGVGGIVGRLAKVRAANKSTISVKPFMTLISGERPA